MRRRDFIKVVAGSAVTWPLAARSQQTEQVRRIGVLMNSAPEHPEGLPAIAAFRRDLQRLGWDEHNMRIDIRWVRMMSIALANTQPNWSPSHPTLFSPPAQ